MKKYLSVLILAACTTGDLTPPINPLPTRDTCNAAKLAPVVGQHRSVLEKILLLQPIRMIEPNSAVTLDYNAERLNVDLDKTGLIVRLWCG